METRKAWLKGLKAEIMELRYKQLSDREIKKRISKEFRKRTTVLETAAGFGFWVILIALVGFGVHIGYAVLMWEMHLYAFSTYFSPYTSLLLFFVLCFVLCVVVFVWFGYFVDFFRFQKTLNDTLEEQFYLKLCKALLLLGLVGFGVFMVLVFFVGLQISQFYGIPLSRGLFEIVIEVFD